MRFSTSRLTPPYRLINFRPLEDLLSAQFLFDLYDQFDPRVNVFRFRNVVGVYRDACMYTYAPESDWQYLIERISRGVESFAFPGRVERLEQLFVNKKERLLQLMAKYDAVEEQFEQQSNAVLCDWLVELYYQALNEIFVMNLVPLEVGYYQRLLSNFREEGRSERDLLLFIDHHARWSGMTTVAVADRRRLIELARRERSGALDPADLDAAIRLIQDHSVGYGALPRTRQSIEMEYHGYLGMQEDGVRALMSESKPESEVPAGHRALSPFTQQLLSLYTQIGALRDRNKALLGCTVRRRQQLIKMIADRTQVPLAELRLYLLDEIIELLMSGRTIDTTDRAQCFVLSSSLVAEIRDRAENTAAVVSVTNSTPHALRGISASPGLIEANARVVNQSESVASFLTGEILVASGTDFHLLDAMLRAAAVVTVEGGLLSHASVVCRERGIPCIIGVTDALLRIKTGDRLRVDATEGAITLLSSPSTDGSLSNTQSLGAIGKKAEMLRRVEAAGLRVSPFLVLTEEFFHQWLERSAAGMDAFLRRSSAQRRDCIQSLSTVWAGQYLQELATRFGDSKLAVRSSAHYEDGLHHSYAGMFASMTFVPAHGEAIAKAVKNCWAALFTKELDEYRKIDTSQAATDWYLPLMIQEMVPAVVSGVLFTRDPLTQEERVVVEISSGGCFEITDGTSCDERLTWSSDTPQIQSCLLDAGKLTQLQSAVRILTSQVGPSLDIEWSFDCEARLVIHQVRPITEMRSSHANR